LPSEMQICEMMDVSRTVVREAIRTLTGKGLVEARPKSGTRVRPPEQWNQLDPDVLRWRLETSDMDSYLTKLFQLRCAVEPAAAALAATSAGETDIAAHDTHSNPIGDLAVHVADQCIGGMEHWKSPWTGESIAQGEQSNLVMAAAALVIQYD